MDQGLSYMKQISLTFPLHMILWYLYPRSRLRAFEWFSECRTIEFDCWWRVQMSSALWFHCVNMSLDSDVSFLNINSPGGALISTCWGSSSTPSSPMAIILRTFELLQRANQGICNPSYVLKVNIINLAAKYIKASNVWGLLWEKVWWGSRLLERTRINCIA